MPTNTGVGKTDPECLALLLCKVSVSEVLVVIDADYASLFKTSESHLLLLLGFTIDLDSRQAVFGASSATNAELMVYHILANTKHNQHLSFQFCTQAQSTIFTIL